MPIIADMQDRSTIGTYIRDQFHKSIVRALNEASIILVHHVHECGSGEKLDSD